MSLLSSLLPSGLSFRDPLFLLLLLVVACCAPATLAAGAQPARAATISVQAIETHNVGVLPQRDPRARLAQK